jgi:type VI secretion system secreted protein VgrG
MDRLAGGLSPYKPEVRYDMSKTPPEPIMSRNDPSRPTTGNPKGNKHPDVTVLHDPSRPLSRNNIKEIVEMKFGADPLSDDQMRQYERIAGGVRFRVLSPDECGCPERAQEPAPEPEPVTVADVVEVAALSLALLWMLLNDAAPGGQVDDVLIPAAIRRLAPTVARLLARLLPRLPPLAPVPPIP